MNCNVSVISTVLNERGAIEVLLGSLISQSKMPDEIIIVDGGSKDGTIDLIREFSQKNNIVKLIKAPGVNIAKGRNIGIKNAATSLLAVIDAGCRPDKKWLEELIRPFKEDNTIDAVSGIIKAECFNDFEFYSSKLMAGGSSEPDDNDFKVLGRSAAFKRDIWAKAGGYPEWLYTAEDTLFDLKLRKIGAKIKLAKNSIVYWRPRRSIWKMAKMFYFYGKGNGRIGVAAEGVYYHLRNYLLGAVLAVVSFFYPFMFVFLAAGCAYLYFSFYRPVINKIKEICPRQAGEFYIPLIIFFRTLSYCMGLLVGNYEYKHKPDFRNKFEAYMEI